MQVYCIRHGESANNVLEGDFDYLHKRSSEPALTETGRQQAEYLAEYVKNTLVSTTKKPVKLYSSYMLRAVQTADVIAQRCHLPVFAWKDLHERGACLEYDSREQVFCPCGGLNNGFFRAHYPNLQPDIFLKDHGWNHLKKPEYQRACYLRARRVLHTLASMPQDDIIILVSHRLFISALLSVVLKAHHSHSDRLYSHNTGVSCLRLSGENFSIRFHNHFHFLPNHLLENNR